eukprot:jgi/Chlat1/3540/Chrsp23S03705
MWSSAGMDSFLSRARELAAQTAALSRDFAQQTAQKSKDLAPVVSAFAQETARSAEQRIRQLATDLQVQPNTALSSQKPVTTTEEELRRYGITSELKDFVSGITIGTFKEFPPEALDPEPATSHRSTNLLPPWRVNHARLILEAVPSMSQLRYNLCPRKMPESRFWSIYFKLVQQHIAPYEAAAAAEEQLKPANTKPVAMQMTRLGGEPNHDANQNADTVAMASTSASASASSIDAAAPMETSTGQGNSDPDLEKYLMEALNGADDSDGDDDDGTSFEDIDQFITNTSEASGYGSGDEKLKVDSEEENGLVSVTVAQKGTPLAALAPPMPEGNA